MKRILVACLGMTLASLLVSAQNSTSPQTSSVMYVERNVFTLKFGASKEAMPMWKEYLERVQKRDKKIHARLLTDVSGAAYSLVLELGYETFAEAEPSQCRLTHQEDWKEFYAKFTPLCERSERTYYRLQVEF
ncbi:MAG TPA: hypothetical protein VIU12_20285 [Chryseolinea sp.]